MDSKNLFASKTFWVNSVGGLLIPILGQAGIELTPEMISTIFAAVNIILRLVTQSAVHVGKQE